MIIALLLMMAEFRAPPWTMPPRLNYERIIFEAYYDDAFEWTVEK